jgi:hypothetical protein
MTWLAWRQLRAEVMWIAIVLAAVAAFVVFTGVEMRLYEGGLGCLGPHATSTCGGEGDFGRNFDGLLSIVGWFNLIPLLIGVFVDAPLVARELERGTHRLVWMQSVTRARWLVVKLGMLALIAVAFGTAMAALMTWWRQPYDIISSPFTGAGFDFEGFMPAVYALFAVTLGVASGTVIRRTLPAMAATVVLFLAVRLPIEFALRQHFMPPIVATASAAGPGAPAGAWVLDSGLVDRSGNPVDDFQVLQACGRLAGQGAEKIAGPCLSAHGWFGSVVYQPVDRFWPFQLIEAGIFLAVTAALVSVTVVWVRSRLR